MERNRGKAARNVYTCPTCAGLQSNVAEPLCRPAASWRCEVAAVDLVLRQRRKEGFVVWEKIRRRSREPEAI